MILMLLGALLSILIPAAIYKHILKGQETVNKKLYIKTFLLAATLYTLPIIILGLTWDAIFGKPAEVFTVTSSLVFSFLRAAMLEEAVKYFFAYRLLKRNPALGMKESILLAGIIGIGYGFTEKLAYFNPMAIIMNGVLPGHMLFQWIMGFFLYKALHTEGTRKYHILAFVIPFLVHGLWDFSMDSIDFVQEASVFAQSAAVIFTAGMVILMFAGILVGTRKIRKIQE